MITKKSSWFSLTSGLLSLMICWFFWIPVYGIMLTMLTFLMATAAVISGRRLKKQYKRFPESLDKMSLRNAKYGYWLGVIGILFSIICFVFGILFYFYYKILT
jgi:hypothetical protein